MSKKSAALIRGALLFVFGFFIVLFLAEMPKALGGATGAETAHADAPGGSAGASNVGCDGSGVACVCEYIPGVEQDFGSFDACGSGGSCGASCP